MTEIFSKVLSQIDVDKWLTVPSDLENANSAYLQPENADNNNNNNNEEDVAASTDDDVHNSTGNRERQQGVTWTEEENRLFLLGLQKLGKGNWRGISRNFVKTRTPTQVATYAQLYFNKQSNAKRLSRRSTLFDINADISNDSRYQMEDTDTNVLPLLSETEHRIDIDPNPVNPGTHNEDGGSQKVILERIFVITNFVLEIPSAVFEQLSSVHKPQYALFSMLISFIAMLVCIVELIYKGRKEKGVWRWTGCNFNDIIGLACAIPQFIVSAITYSFVHRNADNPIKICVWPIIFAFGLLCSKLLERPNRKTPSSKRDS